MMSGVKKSNNTPVSIINIEGKRNRKVNETTGLSRGVGQYQKNRPPYPFTGFNNKVSSATVIVRPDIR